MPQITLVIINGTLCTDELWDEYKNRLQSLCPCSVEIIFFDITKDRKSVAEFAQECSQDIRRMSEHSHVENIVVLGYSLGGIIALEVAKQCQQYLSGMILVCANHHGQTPQKEESTQAQLDLLEHKGLEAVFEQILLPLHFGDLDVYRAEVNKAKHMGLSLGEHVYKNQLYTVGTRIDQSECLKDIIIPVLLCYGALDQLCTEAQNRDMHDLFPNSELFGIEQVGHMIPLLCADTLAKISTDYLCNVVKT